MCNYKYSYETLVLRAEWLQGAVDQVLLTFATNEECDSFCQDMTDSIQNMPQRLSAPSVRQTDVDNDETMPRPKKQSRAVMINLSQDAIIGEDTQLLSFPSHVSRKVSTSGAIDVSASTESSVVSTSPLRETYEKEAVGTQSEASEEHLLRDTNLVKHNTNLQIESAIPTNCQDTKHDEVAQNGRRDSGKESSTKRPVALASPEFIHRQKFIGQASEGRLPQNMTERKPETPKIRPSEGISAHLQHVAFEAQENSAEESPHTTPQKRNPSAGSESNDCHSTPEQSSEGVERSSSMPAAQANSAKRMALKPKSAQLHAPTPLLNVRRQPKHTESRTSTTPSKLCLTSATVQSGRTDVDWDEDLREHEDEHKHKTKIGKQSKTSASRRSKTASKKSATIKHDPKGYLSQKKGPKQAKEDKTKTASVNTSLAASRPRRNAANVSYNEQSDQKNQSQESVLDTTEAASTEPKRQIQLEAPPLNTESDPVDHRPQSVDDQSPSNTSQGPIPEPRSSREASVEVYDSNRALSAPEVSAQNTENGLSVTKSSPLGEHRGGKKEIGKDIPGCTVQPQVEAVEDSHPMDEQQRADTINAARKSFGSNLTDTMNQNDMRPIESHHPEVAKKPFGDKAAFAASVKDVLDQSSKKPMTYIAGSRRKKQNEALSAAKKETEAADDIVLSAEGNARNPSEPPAHERLNEKVEHTILLQNRDVAIPSSSSQDLRGLHQTLSLPPNEALRIDQPQPTKVAGSPGLQQIAEKLEQFAETESLSLHIPESDGAATAQSDGRKRGAAARFEDLHQAKRARKTDLGPAVEHVKDNLIQGSALVFQPVVDNTAADITTKSLAPEPSSSDVRRYIRTHEAPAVASILPKEEYAQISGFRTDHSKGFPKLTESPAYTPQNHEKGEHFPVLADDHLLRKARIVGFTSKGPRNQGRPSSAKQETVLGLGQTNSVPTETEMHLAFKKSHRDFRHVGHPHKAIPKPSQIFAGNGKRKLKFKSSDQEPSDDGIRVDEESADDVSPSPTCLNLQNSKSALQSSKVDENGSPRLHPRQGFQISLPSKQSPAAEEIAAIGGSPAAKYIPAPEKSPIVENFAPTRSSAAQSFPAAGHSSAR